MSEPVDQSELRTRLKMLKDKLKLEDKRAEIKRLEKKSADPQFWQDHRAAGQAMKRLAGLQEQVDRFDQLKKALDQDLSLKAQKKLAEKLDQLEEKVFLAGDYDQADALVTIHAGQGGTEACDWAEMLLRMYLKYAESQDWRVEILDRRAGEEAGIKGATLKIVGDYAYGYLKKEKGIHRLVRQSPFNANNLRQTSFASVTVLPVIKDELKVEIKDDDIEMEAFRASGHGGQNVNKVSTAVRIKHLPTGITVESQTQRSQQQNRKIAMEILRAKLWEREEEKRRKKLAKLKGQVKEASWGNQIRSYVLHPYKMVKDLRTKYQENDPDSVLDGNLDGFIQAELKTLA